MALNVVIAGGGFGGLHAARRLERRLPRHSARITLVTDQNFLLYTPLLPGAASGSLEPRHVVVPLREELDWAELRVARVTAADPAARELRLATLDGRATALRYDQLVVAIGSVSRVLPIPGLAEHGVGFKTLPEAIALRNRAILHLEIAEAIDDPERRREYLTFVFVGAGYAGVEGVAELQDYVADALDRYPRCRLDGTRWVLVEATERVMPEIPLSLAAFATRELRGRGIEILTGTRLDAVTERTATLSTGEVVPTRTVCWTAGVKPAAVVRELGLPLTDSGRIDVDATMRVRGQDCVWAIGDAAAVPDPARKGAASPPTAQHAIRQGRVVGDNVAATLAGNRPRRFRYRTLGVFVDMGQHKAVATMLGVRLRGFPAWFAARTYHLLMMPGLARRLRLVADWTVGLLFGRASAELGGLGHPPALADQLDPPPGAGEASGGVPAAAAREEAV
jgi:NADH:ubiquinone reductase (H+-translocating)